MARRDPLSSLPLLAHALPTLAPRDEQILLARLAVERAAQEGREALPPPDPACLPLLGGPPTRTARDTLILANLKLVTSIAHRYSSRGLPLPDLISAGTVGLITAIDKYDPARPGRAGGPCKLSTSATLWIRQAIRVAIIEGSHTIRPPYNPRDDLPACPPVVSMDAVRSGDDANLGHLTIDHREPPADARTLADEDRVTARQILSLLGGRHAEILARRYGVGPGPGAGEVGAGAIVRYEVLSRELGVSKEGARQAVERAAEAARARVRVAKAGARGGDVRRSLAGMGRGA